MIQQARLGKLLIDNAIKAAYSGEIPFSEAMRLTLYSANTIQKKPWRWACDRTKIYLGC